MRMSIPSAWTCLAKSGFCVLLLIGLGLTGCSPEPEKQPSLAAQPEAAIGESSPRNVPEPAAEPLSDSVVESEVSSGTGVTDQARSSLLPLEQTSTSRYLEDVADDLTHLDPQKEGWVGEMVNDAASRQLGRLVTWIEGSLEDPIDPDGNLIAPEFSCSALLPPETVEVFRDPQIVVRRSPDSSLDPSRGADRSFEKAEGFRQAFVEMLAAFAREAETSFRLAFKVVGVAPARGASTTRVLMELNAEGPLGRLQQNATWTCRWLPATEGRELPLLVGVTVHAFEEVVYSPGSQPLFSDVTARVLGDDPTFVSQLSKGVDHWRERLDWRFTQMVTGPHGLAVGDVNGDGLEDLFYCETGGLPNRLYVQQGDGTLLDHSAEGNLDYLEPSSSALLVDLDNDGDADLVMSSGRNLLFFENDGKAQFTRRRVMQTGSVARSLTAVDFDLDGLLDIYVCGYFGQSQDQAGIGRPLPYHDANNGVRNYLLDNVGSWDFADVTEAVGLESNNRRFSYAAAWEDYDQDGDLDLYVANDFGRNNLYRNDDGRFTDVAAEAGVEDLSAGMSVSWGDYNRDGLPDLYVGNMYSAAGNRVAYQRQYRAGDQNETIAQYQRHARGNSLFANRGDGTFQDVSLEAAVTMGRWAWGSNFADLNNDGWEDLVVANGLVTNVEDSGDL